MTTNRGWISHESPDGKDLYYSPTGAIGAPTQFWRLPTAGGPAVQVVDGVLNVPFEVLTRGIYFLERPGPEARLQFFDFAKRRLVTILGRDLGMNTDIGGLSASPDGRILLYGRMDSAVDDLMLVDNIRQPSLPR